MLRKLELDYTDVVLRDELEADDLIVLLDLLRGATREDGTLIKVAVMYEPTAAEKIAKADAIIEAHPDDITIETYIIPAALLEEPIDANATPALAAA